MGFYLEIFDDEIPVRKAAQETEIL